MLIIPSEINVGDRVYMSWNYGKQNIKDSLKTKKQEIEYRVVRKTDKVFGVHSILGDYDMFFPEEFQMMINGTVRKV